MRIFLTGATGHVGSAILPALLRAGHSVVALVRSPAKARAVAAAGVTTVLGDLAEPGRFLDDAAACDAVVHAAFEYGASGEEERGRDQAAALALVGAARHLVYTSSAYLLDTTGRAAVDEGADVSVVGAPGGAWRFALERRILGAPAAVVRLGMVYGGTAGTVADLFASAGNPPQVGAGRASLVYRHDAAELYRAVVERRATGIFHAVDGRPLPAVELVRVASLQGAARGTPSPHTVDILGRDVAVTSTRSLQLGWRPRFASFHDGVRAAFAEWRDGGTTSP